MANSNTAEVGNLFCTFQNTANFRFNGTNGGTIADIIDNSFYLSIQPSNESWASGVVVTALSRVYYKDA